MVANFYSDPALDPAVQQLVAVSVEETMAVYLELADHARDKVAIAAIALREQGRAGRLDASHVQRLEALTMIAPDALSVGHMAKALATLGREASAASNMLIAKMRPILITDDTEYWSFDGCIWALGYLGGAEVAPFLIELEREKPNRAVKSESIYRGAMPREARANAYQKALSAARELLAKKDPGVWRKRQMQIRAPGATEKPKLAGRAWDLRSAANRTDKLKKASGK